MELQQYSYFNNSVNKLQLCTEVFITAKIDKFEHVVCKTEKKKKNLFRRIKTNNMAYT